MKGVAAKGFNKSTFQLESAAGAVPDRPSSFTLFVYHCRLFIYRMNPEVKPTKPDLSSKTGSLRDLSERLLGGSAVHLRED